MKTVEMRIFGTLAMVVMMALSIAAQKNVARSGKPLAAARCSESTLRGSYGANITGTFYFSPTTPVPLASIERVVFDGAGNLTGIDFGSFGGSVTTNPITGTYTLADDCTGTMSVNLAGFTITTNIVVVDEAKEVYLLETNPGAVVTGTMKRQ